MSKKECVKQLQSMGYDASLDNGVVMVNVKNESERLKIARTIKQLEFRGSWGTRGVINDNTNRHTAADEATASSDEGEILP